MAWTRFFRRGRRAQEFARELDSYLAHEVDDNLARGMSRDEAERAARLKLGNRTLVRESERERDERGRQEAFHFTGFGSVRPRPNAASASPAPAANSTRKPNSPETAPASSGVIARESDCSERKIPRTRPCSEAAL